MSEKIIDRKEALEMARAKTNMEKYGGNHRGGKGERIADKKARKVLNRSGLNENKGKEGFSVAKDWPLIAALMAAGIKDAMDLVLLAAKGVAGTATAATFGLLGGVFAAIIAFGWVISILAGIFIAMMMLLAGAGEKKKLFKNTLKKFGVLGLGTGIEAFAEGMNVLPIEILTVLAIIALTVAERKNIIKLPGEKKENAQVYNFPQRKNQSVGQSTKEQDYKKAA